jgi:hypothetical protein
MSWLGGRLPATEGVWAADALIAMVAAMPMARVTAPSAAPERAWYLATALLAVSGSGGSQSSDRPATPQLVAFTVVSGPNGSSALTLRKGAQYRLDPDALRQALAQHGITAVVNVGKMCATNPEPNGLDQVISSRRLADGSVITTFNPAAMPARSEISIGYFPTFTAFALIQDGASLHCTTKPGTATGAGPGSHTQPVPAGQTTSP